MNEKRGSTLSAGVQNGLNGLFEASGMLLVWVPLAILRGSFIDYSLYVVLLNQIIHH